MAIDFTVSPTNDTAGVTDTISLTVTLASAATHNVMFGPITYIPTGPLYPDLNQELFYGYEGDGGLLVPQLGPQCLIPAGSTTGTITFLGSDLGAGAVGTTTTLYVLPLNDAIGLRAGSEVGLPGTRSIVDKYVTITITVTAPPMPPSSSTNIQHRMYGALALPTGGGSPRLYLAIARDITTFTGPPSPTMTVTTTALRFCMSPDFGESFTSGVDMGAHDSTGAAIVDNSSGQFAGVFLIALPTGELYANGNYSPGTARTDLDWQTARLSSDGGRNWRAAAQLNSTVVSAYYVAAALGGTLWVTRGGHQGAKGAGAKSAGAYRFLKSARSSSGGPSIRVESLDHGDTWTIPSDLVGSGIVSGPATQPISAWGVSYDGFGWSTDDFQSSGGYHALTEPGRSSQRLVTSADGDVTYRIWGRAYGPGSQLILLRNRQPFTNTSSEPATVTVPAWWSPNGDGTDLRPIPQPQTMTLVLCWQWKGKVVILTVDSANPSLVQVYVSDNEGAWYRKTCHTTDAGTTWVKD